MADVGAQVYRYLRTAPGLQLSPAQAAGFLGNTQQESSNNPNARGGGLIQGQGGRTSSGTLAQQLASIRAELLGPERGTLQALRGVNDPRAAARLISERFERPETPMMSNRERYAAEALAKYGAGGGAPLPAEAQQTASQPTSAQPQGQSAALLSLISQLGQPQGPSTSVEGISLPKPTEQQAQGPHAPRELPSQGAASPADLLSLISQIGQESPETQGAGVQANASNGQSASNSPNGYVNPLPGFKKGRTDQGVDYSATPGAPIKAIGNATVLGVSPDWYRSQPYVYYRLNDGPQRGKVIFVAEQITPSVKSGQQVKAGQAIGHYAPSGTGVEIGYGTPTGGQTLAKATTGYNEGEETPAGKQVRRLLEGLGAR